LLAGMNKELTWAEHIHRCLELGVSKKAYCEEHNLSYQLFFHHQRKLTESKSPVGFKEILLRNEHMQNRESDDASESVLQVQFANGCTLFFSEHLLESVFQLCQSQ
jgi:ABC-type branched-subunit amino acid transport system ATPase component